jgi:hypothetical protein
MSHQHVTSLEMPPLMGITITGNQIAELQLAMARRKARTASRSTVHILHLMRKRDQHDTLTAILQARMCLHALIARLLGQRDMSTLTMVMGEVCGKVITMTDMKDMSLAVTRCGNATIDASTPEHAPAAIMTPATMESIIYTQTML